MYNPDYTKVWKKRSSLVQLSPNIKKTPVIEEESPEGTNSKDKKFSLEISKLKKVIEKKKIENKNNLKLFANVNRDNLYSRETKTPVDDNRKESF